MTHDPLNGCCHFAIPLKITVFEKWVPAAFTGEKPGN
jgi:hypothetical protein